MSQMLVRIDKETDKALTYIYDHNGTVSLNEVAVVMGIVRRIYEQWKPNHEAMLKLREEARKKNAAKS
jgi:ABC-type protease/lipase transport system fused ATPase/permease subunit